MSEIAIQTNVPLAPLTTMKLGGNAAQFAVCRNQDEIQAALEYAREHTLPLHVLGGGSNTIFSDAGFAGLVIHIANTGREFRDRDPGIVDVTVQAGDLWDEFVADAIARNLAGVECLSGIPGLVGAAPMQNIGAYGQSVAETITEVEAIEVATGTAVTFTNDECQFGYRASRFKYNDAGRYIITAVTFRLRRGGEPTLRYHELAQLAKDRIATEPERPPLAIVREAVIELRSRKSMIVRDDDPYSRSCGSFFMNVVVDKAGLADLTERFKQHGGTGEVLAFPQGDTFKVPSAWLIEHAGFPKGTRRGGVGISPNHNLALINYNGTTKELLAFAEEIQTKVKEIFGIDLIREPVVV